MDSPIVTLDRCHYCSNPEKPRYTWKYIDIDGQPHDDQSCNFTCGSICKSRIGPELICLVCKKRFNINSGMVKIVATKCGAVSYFNCSSACGDSIPNHVVIDENLNCDWCRKPNANFTCSNCKISVYCNSACQTSAWPYHKVFCYEYMPEKVSKPSKDRCRTNIFTGEKFHEDSLTSLELLIFDDWTSFKCQTCHKLATFGHKFDYGDDDNGEACLILSCSEECFDKNPTTLKINENLLCEQCFKFYDIKDRSITKYMRHPFTLSQYCCSRACSEKMQKRYIAASVKAGYEADLATN